MLGLLCYTISFYGISREKRIKIDLVHDDVQKNLIKEVETIQGVQQMLQKTLDQVTEQVRLDYATWFVFIQK